MANDTTGDMALARLAERLAAADLIGFDREGDRIATAKVGEKNPPPSDQTPK
jgi:hypothetical protein